ncbi:uncharacterized protein TRUGW13939_11766 [Talaromyces rugulosus]|uniref:Uncharacterized protein n=1 Tax=Talaromyces rugulosus TaxID=121627 RepID=A0A7H8RFT4_TALRU|nr:uncharacterized protein TRUGW13939_11766 [Talaromyces rugulosus]QKX64591.1 hypothetical protein TRUGW13939_11766 [Talaromyces rugulosus]
MSSRRHYSWPFSGSSKAQELPLPYHHHHHHHHHPQQRPFTSSPSSSSLQQHRLQRKRPIGSLKDTFNRPLSPDTLTFPYSSSDEEDVFASAGIISSKEKPRRRRSKRRRRSRVDRSVAKKSHKNEEKLEKLENNKTKEARGEPEEEEEVIVSSITEANHLPSAVLRRIIRPRLEKAKQFLIPLHLHFLSWSAATTTTPLPIRGREEKVVLSCASTPVLLTKFDDMLMDVPTPIMPEDWGFRPGRRHRRCHSEQPRAWREPSPGLWTLAEE